jgi:hypothetical protein
MIHLMTIYLEWCNLCNYFVSVRERPVSGFMLRQAQHERPNLHKKGTSAHAELVEAYADVNPRTDTK